MLKNASLFSSTFASQNLFEHFTDFLEWFDREATMDCWTTWHEATQMWIIKLPAMTRLGIYMVQVVPVRIILLISAMAAMEVQELEPKSLTMQREMTSLVIGMGAIISTGVLFITIYPISARHIFKVQSHTASLLRLASFFDAHHPRAPKP